MTIDRPLLGFHAPGDPTGGAAWREAVAAGMWAGPVHFPDLPGHGGAAPPIGRTHDLIEPAYGFARLVGQNPEQGDVADRVVIGVGVSGWSAQLVALAGRATALVLVDGLQGPFVTVAEHVAQRRAAFRAQADRNIAAIANPELDAIPPGGLDPRLQIFPAPIGSRAVAEEAAHGIDMPTLIIESAESGTAPSDADAVAPLFNSSGGGAVLQRVERVDETAVIASIINWL